MLAQYNILRELSKTDLGQVLLAEKLSNKYIIKILPEEGTEEIFILQDLVGVEGVPQYIDHFNENGKAHLILKYIEGVDLYTRVEKTPLTEQGAKHVFRQLCEILKRIHSKGIVHRDLKPENIILGRKNKVTIIDWGFAFYPQRTSIRRACGSPNYAAPELWGLNVYYDGPEVDVWSLGVVLYAMLASSLPFTGKASSQEEIIILYLHIQSCKVNYNLPEITPDVRELLERIFVKQPNRITVTELLEHPWLK